MTAVQATILLSLVLCSAGGAVLAAGLLGLPGRMARFMAGPGVHDRRPSGPVPTTLTRLLHGYAALTMIAAGGVGTLASAWAGGQWLAPSAAVLAAGVLGWCWWSATSLRSENLRRLAALDRLRPATAGTGGSRRTAA